jgi:hypothetical protein
MPVNADASEELDVSFRPAPPGACFTDEQLAQLASMLVVKLPQSALEGQSSPCASKDANNIASIDADNCLLVPAAEIYRAEETWDADAPSTNVEFTTFADLGFDATTCMLAVHIYLGSTETGTEVQKQPSGSAFIRPNYEIVERSASKIEIAIKNAEQDVRVEIELLKLPLPVESA